MWDADLSLSSDLLSAKNKNKYLTDGGSLTRRKKSRQHGSLELSPPPQQEPGVPRFPFIPDKCNFLCRFYRLLFFFLGISHIAYFSNCFLEKSI